MTEPMGEAVDELLRKVDKLEAANRALMDRVDGLELVNGSLCAEINRQEGVIERLKSANDALDGRVRYWNDSYYEEAERVRKLESLLVDVWPYVWELRIPGRRDEEFEARFKELGLEES